MNIVSNSRKVSKGDRLNWPSTQNAQPVHFNTTAKPEKLSEKDLAAIRQSKGKPLVP